MTAFGLVLLVLTMPTPDGRRAVFAVLGLIVFEAVALAVGTLLITAPRLGAPAHHHGALLGAANLTCIVGCILVFGDALADGVLLAVQLAALALVALAALVPPRASSRRRSLRGMAAPARAAS